MASRSIDLLARYVRGLTFSDADRQTPDSELLRRYVVQRDEHAFKTLVRRHGAMVLRVCQRVLGHPDDAEDAFQATFVVLMRKAGCVRWEHSIANWLYGVAHRVGKDLRKKASRRHRWRADLIHVPSPLTELTLHEAQEILDEELGGLAERYRAPLVLCYLEGATRDEAAQQLGWSLATLKRRLDQGRKLLQARVTRRGLTLPGALLATTLASSSASALSPAVTAKLGATLTALSAGSAGGAASARVVMLADAIQRGLWLCRLKGIVSLVLAGAFVSGAAGLLGHRYVLTESSTAAAPATPVSIQPVQPPTRQTMAAPSLLRQALASGEELPASMDKLHVLLRGAQLHARAGDQADARMAFREALELAELMAVRGEQRHLEVRVAAAQAEVGYIGDALVTAGGITDCYYRGATLAQIAGCQAHGGDWPGAERTIAAIRALNDVPFPHSPTPTKPQSEVIEHCLFSARASVTREYLAVKDVAAALQTVRSIPRGADRLVLLAEIAITQAKEGKQADAEQVLEEAGATFRQAYGNPHADKSEKNWNQAFMAAARYRLGGHAAAACTASSLQGEARDVFLTAVAMQRIKDGEFTKAKEITNDILNAYSRTSLLKTWLVARARNGDLAGAIQDSEALDPCDRGAALADLAQVQASAGDKAGAVQTVRRAQEYVVLGRRVSPTIDLLWSGYREVALAFVAIGQEEAARAWAESEQAPVLRSWILLNIAEGLFDRNAGGKQPDS